MMKYIFRDLISVLRYLPYGLALGIPLAVLLLYLIKTDRVKMRRELASAVWLAGFSVYLAILLMITFFSRESGSGVGKMDLQLLSTWGINDRNNAYVVENVLLFIPYGLLSSLAFSWAGNLLSCTFFGAVTSVAVECLQLVTGRGFFQIDDILTNILGTMIGYLLFWIFKGRKKQ